MYGDCAVCALYCQHARATQVAHRRGTFSWSISISEFAYGKMETANAEQTRSHARKHTYTHLIFIADSSALGACNVYAAHKAIHQRTRSSGRWREKKDVR